MINYMFSKRKFLDLKERFKLTKILITFLKFLSFVFIFFSFSIVIIEKTYAKTVISHMQRDNMYKVNFLGDQYNNDNVYSNYNGLKKLNSNNTFNLSGTKIASNFNSDITQKNIVVGGRAFELIALKDENSNNTQCKRIKEKEMLNEKIEQAINVNKDLNVMDTMDIKNDFSINLDPTKPDYFYADDYLLDEEIETITEGDIDDLLKKSETPILLTAIFFMKKNKVAVIDGKLLKEGDKVKGNTIVKIYKDKVRLKTAEEDIILRLPGIKIKSEIK